VAGEPLEVVVGWAEFCGLRIRLDRGVFVPRQRTRFLVEQAVSLIGSGAVVVDLCCGSGAIGAVLANRVTGVALYAADIDATAVACARGNLTGRGQVFRGDLFAALPGYLRGRVDVLVCNAPYVPTAAIALMPPEARLHEPSIALDGGSDGLVVLRRVAADAAAWLARDGHLLVETGEDQVAAALLIFGRQGLSARVVESPELAAHVIVARPSSR
jgi:release factor glutamine methyltransferase